MEKIVKIGNLIVKSERLPNSGILLKFTDNDNGFKTKLSDFEFKELVKKMKILSKIFEAEKEFETDEDI